ncbi:hypothetical protein K457DRAFT_349284 [Linnemannia elongata AG-77]|uniref:Uncharacterized protein n=1 Tax=Linnemannia elongata AG-77 TaxID=1314771 RepID=A0A197K5F3_9FUNG|nr:hypothetical protein K457DRAFT_349284 [Linnemannia elongata AG-77]
MAPTLSTLSSEAPSSATTTTLAPYPKQRQVTRATIFLITITLACCLLSSATTTFAAPAAKPPSKNLLRQRSLAHQVHHVQVADESVHNNVVLLKKSIEKRKSQKRSQSPQQQHPVQQGHTTATTKEKRTKRHAKREIVDSSFSSVPVPEDHTASNGKDVRVDVSVDLNSIDATTAETHRSSSTFDDNSATVQQSNKHVQKKKLSGGGGHHRARLLSAYESIIFSESQIPVFLTQDHHHQRPLRPKHRRQSKGASVSKKNDAERHYQNPIRAEASIPSVIPSSSGDDVAVAQADPPSSSSPSLDSALEQQHTTTSTVAQDSSASNNNNLQTHHVAEDEIIAVGVTEDEPSENDDKNSSLLAAASDSPILQVEQDKEDSTFVPPSIATEESASEPFPSSSSMSFACAESMEAVAMGNEPSQGTDSSSGGEDVVETAAVVAIEDESSSTADEIEDGWVTITNADLADSDSDSTPAESDDIPFSDNTAATHHHQRNTGKTLFHNGCSSSSVITLLGGLLLTVIGLVYRFHFRKQQLEKQQARRLDSSLPLDPKAPLSTKSSEGKSSAHRLSVDSVTGLKREGDSGRTTAMRDYVGFNMQ